MYTKVRVLSRILNKLQIKFEAAANISLTRMLSMINGAMYLFG